MDNSLSKEATDWREGRRLRAFELKQEGWSQQQIADVLGVSKGAVSQWMKRARQGGFSSSKAPTCPWSTAVPERGATRQGARASGAGS
jgi:IS30 family transposase